LKQDDFIRYRDYLRGERQFRASTVWVRFVALNRFFFFLKARDPKVRHPMDFSELKLVPPKKDKGYYDILTEAEVKRLYSAPDTSAPIGKRDYLILRLMLVYGLRVNEICRLKWKDADRERYLGKQRLWIRDRKGRIGRREDTQIILEGSELKAWDSWIESCGLMFEPEDRVFAPYIYDLKFRRLEIDRRKMKTGRARVHKTVWNLITKYMDDAGIERGDRKLSPHALRHTCFTFLLRNGVNLIDVKKLAAHQDVSTTMIYAHAVQSFEDHVGMKNPLAKL
jgi:site-specific recombinase XerD